jgi:predicted pyridoxine 5'-phosphate oxidase superfamily flavin-nucleotide-binding protein
MKTISPEATEIIEHNPIVLATTTPEGMPNAIAVAAAQVIDKTTILVTDVFMNQTLKDIAHKPDITVLAWDKDMTGYKMIGRAEYYTTGKWFDMVKTLPDNYNLTPKGAVIIRVEKIFKTA